MYKKGKVVPNNVPNRFKKKLELFIKKENGIFGTMYYKPLRARIVNPNNFVTMFIVNLENGRISPPKKGVKLKDKDYLTLDDYQ